jgi:hypothetical protein
VDHHLAALVDEDHEFEQIAGSIRSDDEPSVWVLANVLDRQCVCNGMLDVEIVDAMPASREWISTRQYRTTESKERG